MNYRDEADQPLTAAEVARMFGIDPKSVARAAQRGALPAAFRTPGGHRRWRRSEIEAFIEQSKDRP